MDVNALQGNKIPMLKVGDYDMWKFKIKQHLNCLSYELWNVIVNGDDEEVKALKVIKSSEQKHIKKIEVQAKNLLLMALPNEYQHRFSTYESAKDLWEAIEARFEGNSAIKKSKKNLLKAQYENFTGSSSDNIDQVFDKLQKLISQLEMYDVKPERDELNLKFLRSLPSEWATYVAIWKEKDILDQISLDNLYNNLKVHEDVVRKDHASSSDPANMAFLSHTSNKSEGSLNN